jgi:1-acyl-sn-glycerol-3-phosphate acyltransferase
MDTRPKSMRRRVINTCWLMRLPLVFAAWLKVFVRPEVFGRDEQTVPKEGAVLYAVNHPSTIFDIFAVFGALRRRRDVAFMAKADLFRAFLLGAFLSWLGHIPVERRTKEEREAGIESARARAASDLAVTYIRAGAAMVVYYEGRSDGGEQLLEPRGGVAYIAAKTGVPVVPVSLVATNLVKPAGSPLWKWSFGRRYVVVFGRPIRLTRSEESEEDFRRRITKEYVGVVTDNVQWGRQRLGMPPLESSNLWVG